MTEKLEELFKQCVELAAELKKIDLEIHTALGRGLNGSVAQQVKMKELPFTGPVTRRGTIRKVQRRPHGFWSAAVADYVLKSGNLTFTVEDIAGYLDLANANGAYSCNIVKPIGAGRLVLKTMTKDALHRAREKFQRQYSVDVSTYYGPNAGKFKSLTPEENDRAGYQES